jgi:sulfate permease, SulP family
MEHSRFGSRAYWRLFVPKSIVVLARGYGLTDLRHDAVAGLTVAIVALPLAMALAIASGTTPEKGLVTAVVAGFLISALGGSRFQIGGPTGAFVVVVFDTIARHGYDGLVLATLLAGLILICAGFARFGTWIKYIPDPVITGFTAGIAVIIATSQVKDLLGLPIAEVPAHFVDKWPVIWAHIDEVQLASLGLGLAAFAIIVLLRRFAPQAPGFLIAVLVASLAAAWWQLPVATIGSAFGELPDRLSWPELPEVSFLRVREVLPSAFTIAFLAGVESLLSAIVADGMTGRRHRSNVELVAQGIANTASALVGGMPATGAIARTATNIRAGARSPLAGMIHALLVLAFMVLFARWASYIPLPSLAAVLIVVAWTMSEPSKFVRELRAPIGDRLILLTTFALTVLVDLTFAIEVGIVLAAIAFMHQMAQAVAVQAHAPLIDQDVDDFARPRSDPYTQRAQLPADTEVYQVRGPLFFGAATRLDDMLSNLPPRVRTFILRMGEVPLVDATGARALRDLALDCERRDRLLILSEIAPSVRAVLEDLAVRERPPFVRFAAGYREALALAAQHTDRRSPGSPPLPRAG